jgi:hypothetical protein
MIFGCVVSFIILLCLWASVFRILYRQGQFGTGVCLYSDQVFQTFDRYINVDILELTAKRLFLKVSAVVALCWMPSHKF